MLQTESFLLRLKFGLEHVLSVFFIVDVLPIIILPQKILYFEARYQVFKHCKDELVSLCNIGIW